MTAAEIADKLRAAGGDTADLSPVEQELLMRALRTYDDMLDFARNIASLDDRLLNDTQVIKEWRDDARAAIAKADTRFSQVTP